MVWASYSQFQQAVRTRKNQFELVTASFNDKEKSGLSQFFEELVCLCHAQQPVSTTRKNQFEEVTASLNDKKKPVWAS